MTSKAQVIYDAERMRYPNTGLYHYNLHLGNSLTEIGINEKDISIKFYSSKLHQVFNNSPSYLDFNALHRYFLPVFSPKVIWHCNYQLSNYIPSSKRIKKVITIHDLNFLREKEADKHAKYLKNLQRNLDKCDVIVCISEFVKKELLAFCDVKSKPIEVIYNGNNINSLSLGKPLHMQGLDLSKPFLFSIGVVLPKKNFLVLVNLLVHNDLNLVISGELSDMRYQKEILDLATQLGVRHRVFLTGPISEEEKYYLFQNCHTFCFPSITEGFGLPVVEAMHFGCNILLSPHTSLPEIGGDVVRYFDSFDAKYLEELGKEIPSWELTEQQTDNVKLRSQLFTWKNAAIAYWRIYLGLLKQ